MSEYRCSQCGTTYSHTEYMALKNVPLNPDDEDPKHGSGYESVCDECGSRIHSEKWSLRETVDTDDGEITISTVALLIPHGLNHDQWFETCIFHQFGDYISDRYHTQEEAEAGHERRVGQIEAGDYRFVPTGKQIQLGTTE